MSLKKTQVIFIVIFIMHFSDRHDVGVDIEI